LARRWSLETSKSFFALFVVIANKWQKQENPSFVSLVDPSVRFAGMKMDRQPRRTVG
jgi:hypothetical protein